MDEQKINIIYNEACKDCGMCCEGKISGNPPCPSLTTSGCAKLNEDRPYACRMFPFVIIRDKRFKNQKRIFLDLSCPYWHTFLNVAQDVGMRAADVFYLTIYASSSENE